MISVIIAGGSGTRLWPLSTPDYPKHLLQVNGNNQTLVQSAYERMSRISSQVFVVTDASHAHHVKEQLPELKDDHFIIEPARRGTAGCTLAGLAAITPISADEPIAFVPADHYIRDIQGFNRSFRIAQNVSKKENKVAIIGIEPAHASTGLGYIEKGKELDDQYVFEVKGFTEKPDYEVAKKYVKSGNYLWNSGYLVGSVNAFLESMAAYAPKMKKDYETLAQAETKKAFNEAYQQLENISIDYALNEHVEGWLLIPASFDWMDLGSYADLHQAAESDAEGNHAKGDVEIADVQNSFLQNHEDKPMAVIGLDNIVVINTKHGIIVARKDLSQAVGDIAKRIHKRSQS